MLFFIFLIHAGVLVWMFIVNDSIFVDYKNLLLGLSVFIVGLCVGFFFGNDEEKTSGVDRIKTGEKNEK